MGTAICQATSSMDMAADVTLVEEVKQFLGSLLDERSLPQNLVDAIRYSLLGAGKCLRPILVIRSCEAVGGKSQRAMPAAAAIEMIHCFSLVHDDLPAMDDDDLRRGRPTLHRHATEGMAILAGDAMTALAFEVAATRITPPSVAVEVARELAVATGDMIGGQVYDTLGGFEPSMEDLDRLRMIHRYKTGALIRAACRIGGMCGHADNEQLDALTRFSLSLGLMFQVVDDLLDVTQTTKHLGKRTQKDADQGKLTYPAVLGFEASRTEIQRLCVQANEALESLGNTAQPLRELCEYMAVRTR